MIALNLLQTVFYNYQEKGALVKFLSKVNKKTFSLLQKVIHTVDGKMHKYFREKLLIVHFLYFYIKLLKLKNSIGKVENCIYVIK